MTLFLSKAAAGYCLLGVLIVSLGNSNATTVNLTGTSIRVSGTTVLPTATSGTLADATDGVGNVIFSNQFFGSGSGVYTALFRIQNTGSEQGYNSYAGGSPPMDQKNGVGDPEAILGPSNMSVNQLSDTLINIGGEEYYQLTLDLNEDQSTGRWISLDNVAIYTTPRTTDPKYTSLAQMDADSQLNAIWRMDYGSVNNAVLLNANLTPGSGHDNMVMLLRTSLFTGISATDHVYVYNQFGVFNAGGVTTEYLNGVTWTSNSFVSEATFEEWSLYTDNAIPEPGTVGAFGLGVALIIFRRRRA